MCPSAYADEAAAVTKKRGKAFDGVRERVKKDLLDMGIGEQDYEAKMLITAVALPEPLWAGKRARVWHSRFPDTEGR